MDLFITFAFFAVIGCGIAWEQWRKMKAHIEYMEYKSKEREESLLQVIDGYKQENLKLRKKSERREKELEEHFSKELEKASIRVPGRFFPNHNCKFTVQSVDEDGNIVHSEELERKIYY